MAEKSMWIKSMAILSRILPRKDVIHIAVVTTTLMMMTVLPGDIKQSSDANHLPNKGGIILMI